MYEALSLVVDSLFASQSTMGLRVGLRGECSGNSVLIAALRGREGRPFPGDGVVVKQD